MITPTIFGLLHNLEHERESSLFSLPSLFDTLLASLKARFNELLRRFGIDVPSDTHCMFERFLDPVFLMTPVLDARFQMLWLDSLLPPVKVRVIDKISVVVS